MVACVEEACGVGPPDKDCNSTYANHVRIGRESSVPYLGLDYCLHYGNVLFRISAEYNDDHASVAELYSEEGFGYYSIEANPLFFDASSLDFRLQGPSPCLNAGDDFYLDTEFSTVFPGFPNIQHDFRGTSYTDAQTPIGAFLNVLQ